MKRAAPLLVILATAAVAQGLFTYDDANLSVRAKDALITTNQANGDMHFDLRGTVTIVSKSQGMKLAAGRVVSDMSEAKGAAKKSQIKAATATGSVRIDQTVTGAQAKRTTITSNKAVYKGQGDGGVVTLTGSVRIVSVDSKNQTFVATGASGTAILDPKAGSSSGLRSATLNGPVAIDVQETGRTGHIVARGDRLDVNRATKPTTLTLSGHVTIQGQGDSSMGTANAPGRAIFTLNDKGEFQSIRMVK
jgi:hypothetical protein